MRKKGSLSYPKNSPAQKASTSVPSEMKMNHLLFLQTKEIHTKINFFLPHLAKTRTYLSKVNKSCSNVN